MATGRGRGGIRRWRAWLQRALHHSADDDRRPVQAADRSRHDDDRRLARPAEQSRHDDDLGPGTAVTAQASLDQVLRRAAAAREAVRDDPSG